MIFVKILIVGHPGDHVYFDYSYQDTVSIGSIVFIPFGRSQRVGIVWDYLPNNYEPSYPKNKIQSIEHVTLFVLSQNCLNFMHAMHLYTMMSISKIAGLFIHKDALTIYYKQQYTMDIMDLSSLLQASSASNGNHDYPPIWLAMSQMAKDLGLSTTSYNKLRKAGKIQETSVPQTFIKQHVSMTTVQLNADQDKAYKHLKQFVGGFRVIHLDGVTGSGKTEVFLELVKNILDQNPKAQILILFPEIGMSVQLQDRIAHHLGFVPAVWNTDTSNKTKALIWQGVYDGQISVVVGARSALFLPWKNLQIIIMDESHDDSYKQSDGVIYHARDMGVLMAYFYKIFVVLSTATPSLETYYNVKNNKYSHCALRKRYQSVLPTIRMIDMRKKDSEALEKQAVRMISEDPKQDQKTPMPSMSIFSKEALNLIQQTLEKKQQVLVFLNRRGYAPLILCKNCGYQLICPHCSGHLTYHQRIHQYICHLCGYLQPILEECPHCHEATLELVGIGIERLAMIMERMYPLSTVMALSSDTIGSYQKFKSALEDIEQQKVQIMIGTKILTKGFHLPNLTTVIVVNADMGLIGFDLRSTEHSYALMQQVSGRSGREKNGDVLIQTYQPDLPLYKYLVQQDRDAFLDSELRLRKQVGFPPYGKLIAVILSTVHEKELLRIGKILKRKGEDIAQQHVQEHIQFFGPSPAPVYKIKQRYRIRFLWIQNYDKINLQRMVRQWLGTIQHSNTLNVKVDVDPVSFY